MEWVLLALAIASLALAFTPLPRLASRRMGFANTSPATPQIATILAAVAAALVGCFVISFNHVSSQEQSQPRGLKACDIANLHIPVEARNDAAVVVTADVSTQNTCPDSAFLYVDGLSARKPVVLHRGAAAVTLGWYIEAQAKPQRIIIVAQDGKGSQDFASFLIGRKATLTLANVFSNVDASAKALLGFITGLGGTLTALFGLFKLSQKQG